MITIRTSGDDKTSKFLNSLQRGEAFSILERYGQLGVDALSMNTPVDTGLTAESWYYRVSRDRGRYAITWHNSNVVDGLPVAILIQYGHGTRGGTFVSGYDYINPVIIPLFEKIADDIWRELMNG